MTYASISTQHLRDFVSRMRSTLGVRQDTASGDRYYALREARQLTRWDSGYLAVVRGEQTGAPRTMLSIQLMQNLLSATVGRNGLDGSLYFTYTGGPISGESGHGIGFYYLPDGESPTSTLDIQIAFYAPIATFSEEPPQQSSDIETVVLDGWAEGFVQYQPTTEWLDANNVPRGVRPYARSTALAPRTADAVLIFHEGQLSVSPEGNASPSPEELVAAAREEWRAGIRMRRGLGSTLVDEGFEARRAEHRAKTKSNFESFVRQRTPDETKHVGTLPFVPHGLASSRRWGIEVESGGARGVSAPADWESKGDGSLRSAYDGYVEVQDFEPYDEEVSERIYWDSCENSENHNPRTEIFNASRDEYIYIPNEDYINPSDCESCGEVTRLVRREPSTITHTGRSSDCREFVSPILTSMHSNGLEFLCTELSKRPQNSSAGVHVHVEANDLTAKQIAIMVYGYDILEPLLEASYQRERRDFCERRDAEEVLQAARLASTQDGYQYNSGRRYSTLNTHSLGTHGTLEFRAMGPVYDYDYLVRWAMLCRELVNVVAAGATTKDFAKIRTWEDLLVLLALHGKEYVRAAAYELTGEVGEAAKLEKAGDPVTTEALNADLGIFSTDFRGVMASMRRLSDLTHAFAAAVPRANSLVTAGVAAEV